MREGFADVAAAPCFLGLFLRASSSPCQSLLGAKLVTQPSKICLSTSPNRAKSRSFIFGLPDTSVFNLVSSSSLNVCGLCLVRAQSRLDTWDRDYCISFEREWSCIRCQSKMDNKCLSNSNRLICCNCYFMRMRILMSTCICPCKCSNSMRDARTQCLIQNTPQTCKND